MKGINIQEIIDEYTFYQKEIDNYIKKLKYFYGNIEELYLLNPTENKDFQSLHKNYLISYKKLKSIYEKLEREQTFIRYNELNSLLSKYEGYYKCDGTLLTEEGISFSDAYSYSYFTEGNYGEYYTYIYLKGDFIEGFSIDRNCTNSKPYGLKDIDELDITILKEYQDISKKHPYYQKLELLKFDFSITNMNYVKLYYNDKFIELSGIIDIGTINPDYKYMISGSINYADEFDYSIFSVCTGQELIELLNNPIYDTDIDLGTNQRVRISSEELKDIYLHAVELKNKKELEKILNIMDRMSYIDILSEINK